MMYRKDGTPFPIHDPHSTKYPNRKFYAGSWRTPERIERKREWQQKYNHSEKGKAISRKHSYDKYWSDPFEPLKKQQHQREWRARKREGALHGG
jgi:hypothetical protein